MTCRIESCNQRDGDTYGLCAIHTQTAYFVAECAGRHDWDGQHYRKVNVDGSGRCVVICRDCWRTENRTKCAQHKFHVTIHDGQKESPTPECEHHTCTSRDTQDHHWAPQALFADANDWPRSWLCVDHHQTWHRVTGTDRKAGAA